MAEVQGIQFEIIGSSKSAVDSLDRLSTALQKIRTASRGGIGLSKIVAEIRALNTAINRVNFDKVANGILKVGVAVKELKLSKLGNLADAFSTLEKMGGVNFNMSSLGQAQQYLAGISKLDFSNLEDAAKAINALSNGSKSGLSDTAQALSDIERYRNGDASVVSRYSLNDTKYQWARDMTSQLERQETGSIREALDPGDVERASSAFKRFGEIVSSVFGRLRSSASGAAEATKEVANAAGKAGGLSELAQVGRNLAGVLGDIAKAAGKASLSLLKLGGKALGSILKIGGKAIAAPFISARNAIGGVASKIKTIFSSIGRIAFYRLIRAGIKLVTEAFTEGIKAAYRWSKVVGGPVSASGMSFAESMDDIATSLQYFKAGIGAAAAPLIGALAPAIRVATDAAIEFLNVINQLMALLTGQSGWFRATRQAEEYEEAVGGAGGAAKEALRYLAPFDELNVLPSQKGGGGGGGLDDTGGMFEEMVEFEQGILDFADRIKKAIEDSDWEGLGKLLGGKINDIVKYLEEGGYFESAGKKIGSFINAWFSTKYWTLDTINFTKIAEDIAKGFNAMIDEIDFEILGRSWTQKFTILGDLLIGAIEGIDWGLAASKVGDLISGAFKEAGDWFKETDFATFADAIWKGIKDIVTKPNWEEIAKSIFDAIGSAVGATASFVVQLGKDIIDDIWTAIKNAAVGWDDNGDGELSGKEIINGIWEGIKKAVKDVGKWIKENIFTPFINGFKSAFGIHSPSTEMEPYGGYIAEGIFEGIKNAWKNIKEWVETNLLNPLKEAIKSGWEDFKKDWLEGEDPWRFDEEITLPVTAEVTGVEAEPGLSVALEGAITAIEDKIQEERERQIELTATIIDLEQRDPMLYQPIKSTAEIIDIEQRGIFDVDTSAHLTKVDKSGLSSKDKTIGVTAQYKWVIKSALSEVQRSLGVTAIYKWVKKGELNDDQRSLGITGVYKWVTKGLLTEAQKTINTISQYTKADKSKLTDSMTTIKTTNKYSKTDFSSLTSADRQIDSTAVLKGTQLSDSIKDPWGRVKIAATADIQGVTGQTTITMIPQALGGVFSNGFWRSIPQYASGGRAHGSMFVAGEAGPEIVGHIGGRTEVLNRSQLAATMYAAVRSAMSGIVIRPVTPESYMDESSNEDMVYRAVVRAINDTGVNDDIELDGDVLYRAMVNRNRRNTRMTGVNAMA